MGFADNSDIFASFHEDGFNKIISHVREQRPSLFNYATADVAKNIELLCKTIDAHPIIFIRNNPLVTIEDPLPIPGTNYGVNFAVQVVDLQIDLHPGDEFDLPSELNPPLNEQRFAIKLTVCGGIGCPPNELVDELIPPPDDPDKQSDPDRQRDEDPIVPLPTRELVCFCLDAYALGGVRIVN